MCCGNLPSYLKTCFVNSFYSLRYKGMFLFLFFEFWSLFGAKAKAKANPWNVSFRNSLQWPVTILKALFVSNNKGKRSPRWLSGDLTVNRNSLYRLPYNSYDASSKNLVLNQLTLPYLIFSFILIICPLDTILINIDVVTRNSVLVTYWS